MVFRKYVYVTSIIQKSSCSLAHHQFIVHQSYPLRVILVFFFQLQGGFKLSRSLLLHKFRGQDLPHSTANRSSPSPFASTVNCASNCFLAKLTAIITAGIQDVKPCCAFSFCSSDSSRSRQTMVSTKTPPLTCYDCQLSPGIPLRGWIASGKCFLAGEATL